MVEKDLGKQRTSDRPDVITFARSKLGEETFRRLINQLIAGKRRRSAQVYVSEDFWIREMLISETRFQLDSLANLTPMNIMDSLGPYLIAIDSLQQAFYEASGAPTHEVIVRYIRFRSPIDVSLDGAADAINSIRDEVVPWRRAHAKALASYLEQEKLAQITKTKAEAAEIRARTQKNRAEATKLKAEAAKLRAEAEKQILENAKLKFDLDREKLELALKLVDRLNSDLNESERLLYAMRMLPALNTLVTSDLELIVKGK